METRHKKSKDENFPVGMLIAPKYRELVQAYYNFARMADDVADNPKLSSEQKLKALNEIEAVFKGTRKSRKYAVASRLNREFVKHNLNASLATDLLIAFRQDAEGLHYQTWGQLINYCIYSAAPVGRFMLAIHNENPATYLPAASLCAALQIVNHIQDIGYDAKVMKRVYIPSDLMDEYGVTPANLEQDRLTPGLRQVIKIMLERTRGLLKEAALLPEIVKSRRLKTEIGVILSLTNSMVKKIESGDVLEKYIKLSKLDWLKALLYGVATTLFTKRKTLNKKGL